MKLLTNIILLLSLGVTGCSEDPKELLISTDPSTWNSPEMLKALSDLDEFDRNCVNQSLEDIQKEWNRYEDFQSKKAAVQSARESGVDDLQLSTESLLANISSAEKPIIEYKTIGELVEKQLACIIRLQ